MIPWQPVAFIAALYELGIDVPEWRLRGEIFEAARRDALARGKPLLNVGCPGARQWAYSDQLADACVDIDTVKLESCRARRPTPASILSLPFGDRQFGAVVCFHVLEHLDSIDEVRQAVRELERVGDRVFVLVPGRSFTAILHPQHHLWLDWAPGGYCVTERSTSHRGFVPLRDAQPVTPSLATRAA